MAYARHVARVVRTVSVAAIFVGATRVSLVSCVPVKSDSDDAGPEPNVTTSVSGEKTLAALTDTEHQQYCNDVGTYIQSHMADQNNATCLSQAFDDGSNLMTVSGAILECKTSFRNCASSPSSVYLPDCSKWTSCQATVAAYSQCQVDTMSAAHAYTADTCDVLGNDGGAKTALTPASCQTLSTQCPGL